MIMSSREVTKMKIKDYKHKWHCNIHTSNTNQETLYVIKSMVLKGLDHLHINKKSFI